MRPTSTATWCGGLACCYPTAIAITPDGRTAYVVSDGNGQAGWVTPIRTASNTALRPIRLGGSPRAILITTR